MSRYRRGLRAAVAGGARAYGFTLVIWTTGALAIQECGRPGVAAAFAFLAGALLGMAAIVFVSFGGPRATWEDRGIVSRAYGAVHLGSVAAAVAAGWLLTALLHGPLAFLAASLVAVVVYNLLLGLELALSSVGDGVALESLPDGTRSRGSRPQVEPAARSRWSRVGR